MLAGALPMVRRGRVVIGSTARVAIFETVSEAVA
jgi:hypothetical protein